MRITETLMATRMAVGPDRGDGIDEGETGIATRTRPKTKKPSNYKVLMLNDDYTPMEFVVLCLQPILSMSIEDATRVMLQVHPAGRRRGACSLTKSPKPRSPGDRFRAREPAPASVHAREGVSFL
jgi:ATP-dependent Clp protease adapter protein ClpS